MSDEPKPTLGQELMEWLGFQIPPVGDLSEPVMTPPVHLEVEADRVSAQVSFRVFPNAAGQHGNLEPREIRQTIIIEDGEMTEVAREMDRLEVERLRRWKDEASTILEGLEELAGELDPVLGETHLETIRRVLQAQRPITNGGELSMVLERRDREASERIASDGDRIIRLKHALAELVDYDECQFDHHGGCQAHGFLDGSKECSNAVALRLLEEGQ